MEVITESYGFSSISGRVINSRGTPPNGVSSAEELNLVQMLGKIGIQLVQRH